MKKITIFLILILAAVAVPSQAATSKSKTHTPTPKATVSQIKPFQIKSSAFAHGGKLPPMYTCDGISSLPPLTWSGVPSAAKSLVLTFDTLPGPPRPGETDSGKHAMFVLYNIPATSNGYTSISDVKGIFGQNFQGRTLGYTPPCSQGPGDKTYTFTAYALSTNLDIAPNLATESAIEKLIADKTLAKSSLSVTYARM